MTTTDLTKLQECITQGSVSFIGSGLSRSLGYRTWLEGICSENPSKPSLMNLAKISFEELKDNVIQFSDLPSIVEFCKGKISLDQFKSFLINEFGEHAEIDQSMNIILVWQTNFRHVITTNFDRSLYDAGMHNQLAEVITFPHENITLTENRTLVYLHGRAFQIDSDIEPIEYFLEHLIYGRNNYYRAYRVTKEIEFFLYSLLREYHIVFLGFSMDDEDFKRMFEKIIKAKDAHEKDIADRYGDNHIIRKEIFIIAEEEELQQPIKSRAKSKPTKHDSFQKMGINIIPFKKKDDYRELTVILTSLKNHAPYSKSDAKERTKKADLNDASTRKGI